MRLKFVRSSKRLPTAKDQKNNKTRQTQTRRDVIAMRRLPRRKFDALPSCYSAINRALPFPTINLRALLCLPPRKIRLLACHKFPRKGGRGLHVVDRQGRSLDRRSRLVVRRVSSTPPSAVLPLLEYFSILGRCFRADARIIGWQLLRGACDCGCVLHTAWEHGERIRFWIVIAVLHNNFVILEQD